METAVEKIIEWIERRQAEYVCVRDVHGVKLAVMDPRLMKIHHEAGMVTPDGMPLVWLAKIRSQLKSGRVCGAELLDALCRSGEANGLRHYFYGGKPGVAEAMIKNLKAKYPNMAVAGFYSPPFSPLTEEENDEIVRDINRSEAQIVWVGLSTPKQEVWMSEHVGKIRGATLIGVGAAFDFHSGAVSRAPEWMRSSGFEWVYRICSEPRRLFPRYVKIVPWFLINAVREQISLYLGPRVGSDLAAYSDNFADNH
ncbi:MAG: WecB/TagA/CpsF family glycosyltransferase [Methylocella sp.]